MIGEADIEAELSPSDLEEPKSKSKVLLDDKCIQRVKGYSGKMSESRMFEDTYGSREIADCVFG